MKRKMIVIDEALCTGCGECLPDCPEGALRIVDGKVRLVKESLCDGLGACVGKCPFGALTIEEREAEPFDAHSAHLHMEQARPQTSGTSHYHGHAGGCPAGLARQWDAESSPSAEIAGGSALRQWPVELKLINPAATYFDGAHLLVCADCVPFALADFHRLLLDGKRLVVLCPKLDNARQEYVEKLKEIFTRHEIRTVTVARMEVPCCSAVRSMVQEALSLSGREVELHDVAVSIQGDLLGMESFWNTKPRGES